MPLVKMPSPTSQPTKGTEPTDTAAAFSSSPPAKAESTKRSGGLFQFLTGSKKGKEKEKAKERSVSPAEYEPITLEDLMGTEKERAVVGQGRRREEHVQRTHPIAIPGAGARGRARRGDSGAIAEHSSSRGTDLQHLQVSSPLAGQLWSSGAAAGGSLAQRSDNPMMRPRIASLDEVVARGSAARRAYGAPARGAKSGDAPTSPLWQEIVPGEREDADSDVSPQPTARRGNRNTLTPPLQQGMEDLAIDVSPLSSPPRVVTQMQRAASSVYSQMSYQRADDLAIDAGSLSALQNPQAGRSSIHDPTARQKQARNRSGLSGWHLASDIPAPLRLGHSGGARPALEKGGGVQGLPGDGLAIDMSPLRPPAEQGNNRERQRGDGVGSRSGRNQSAHSLPRMPADIPAPLNIEYSKKTRPFENAQQTVHERSNSLPNTPPTLLQLQQWARLGSIPALQQDISKQRSVSFNLPQRLRLDNASGNQSTERPQTLHTVSSSASATRTQPEQSQPADVPEKQRQHHQQNKSQEQPQPLRTVSSNADAHRPRPVQKLRVGSAPPYPTTPRGGLLGPPPMNIDRSTLPKPGPMTVYEGGGLGPLPPNLDPTLREGVLQYIPPSGHRRKPFLEELKGLLEAEISFDRNEIPLALKYFSDAKQTPHIQFNIGQLNIFCSAPAQAQQNFERSLEMDHWFCAGWIQLGGMLFQDRRFKDALFAYNEALRCFRDRQQIDYEQLGLCYIARFEEVLWNRAATQRALELDELPGTRPFQVPVGAIFRVPGRWARARLKNVGEGTDWGFKGKGRVVAECESVYEPER